MKARPIPHLLLPSADGISCMLPVSHPSCAEKLSMLDKRTPSKARHGQVGTRSFGPAMYGWHVGTRRNTGEAAQVETYMKFMRTLMNFSMRRAVVHDSCLV